MQYTRSKSGGGHLLRIRTKLIIRAYAHVPHSCTESMHLQSSLQCPCRYACTAAFIDQLAYTNASVEIYYIVSCILVQITPLQDFGAEMGGGGGHVYSQVGLLVPGLYSEFTVHVHTLVIQ